jgi:hypothetical protein
MFFLCFSTNSPAANNYEANKAFSKIKHDSVSRREEYILKACSNNRAERPVGALHSGIQI